MSLGRLRPLGSAVVVAVVGALVQVAAWPAHADPPSPPTAVVLTASRTTLTTGQMSTLTATANAPVGGTGYLVEIFDQTTGAQRCAENTSASVQCAVGWYAVSHTYIAYVAAAGSTDPPPNVQVTSNTATIAPTPFSVILTADTTTVQTGQHATLTATANQPMSNGGPPSGYLLQVFDVTTGSQRCSESTAATVHCTATWYAIPHTYVAYVAAAGTTDPPPSIQATSNALTVSPTAFSVTLAADRTALQTGQTATLTATANQPMSNGGPPSGYVLQIFDATSGVLRCTETTSAVASCSIAWYAAAHAYVAYVSAGGTTGPPPGIQAVSNSVTVSPAPFTVTMTASETWIEPGDVVTFIATANQAMSNGGPSSGYAIQLLDVNTGALVCSEQTSTTLSCARTASWPARTYVALVSPPGSVGGAQAISNAIMAPTTYDASASLGRPADTPDAGDPVNVATGNFFDSTDDLTFPGAAPGLGYVRTYNSRDDRAGVLGRGWSGSYSASVSVDALGNAVVRADDGKALTFAAVAGGFAAPAGIPASLVHRADGTWLLTYARGGDVAFDLTGAVSRVTAADGSAVDLTYSVGHLSSAVASSGHSLAFDYDAAGRLVAVTANDGRAVHFGYAGGLLTTATAADGGVTTYTYDSGRVTTIVDGDGRTKVVNTYDLLGRVTSQVTAHGQRLDFGYSDDAARTSTVTEATTGAVTSYRFDRQARLLQVTDPTGHTATRTYGASGYLDNATDRLSHGVGYGVDANGNVTGRTLPSGTEGYTYDGSNRLVAATDAAGNVTTFGYTGTDRVPSLVTWPDFTTTTQTVAAGLVASTTDADGVTRTFGYDAARNLVTVTDGLGHPTALVYDAAGRLHTRTTPLGETTTWAYDSAGRVTTVTDPTGAVTRTAYDHDGNVTSTTDAAGHTTTYAYDNASELVRTDYPDGTATTYTYDDHGDLLTETRAGGATTTYVYGPLGRLATVTDPAGATTAYGYDANGAVTTMSDGASGVTTTTYDAAGQVALVTDPLHRTTTYVRDALERVTSVTDPTGAVTATSYDARGRVASTTDPLSNTTRYLYTPGGRLDHVTYANGTTRRYTYDAAGRRLTEKDLVLETTRFTYDDDGRLATRTTPQHLTTVYTYDGAGRVLTTTDPGRGTTVTTYTPTGQVATRTDATGGVTRFAYNLRDRLRTATDPNGHPTAYGYDGRGNRTTALDARGHTWSWTYDAADRLTATADPLGHGTTYSYDALGRVLTVADGSGRSRTLTYDAAGQVLRATFGDSTHVDYTYDGDGRVLTATDASGTETTTYDRAGNVRSDSYGGRTVGYTYDILNRVHQITYPDGAVVTNVYDGHDLPLYVTGPDGSLAIYAYDADGRIHTESLPGGVSRDYGYAGRLLTTYSETRNGSTSTTSIARDLAGRITGLTRDGSTTSYGYDPAGQLTSVDAPGAARDATYAYDSVGNMTGSTVGAVTTSRAYDDADQLVTATAGAVTTSYSYDNAGRLLRAASPAATTTETYDTRGRHAATSRVLPGGASVGWARTYSPAGRLDEVDVARVIVPPIGSPVTTTTSTRLTWDTARGIPQVLALATGAVTSDVTYGVGKAFANTGPAPVAVFSHDAQNNLLPTPDTANLVVPGAGYTAYGQPLGANPALAFGYRGELHVGDEIDLRARTYDPATSRFTTRDPLDGIPGEPVATNPYHYAANDPIDAADPSGLNPSITDSEWQFVASPVLTAPTAVDDVAEQEGCLRATEAPTQSRERTSLGTIGEIVCTVGAPLLVTGVLAVVAVGVVAVTGGSDGPSPTTMSAPKDEPEPAQSPVRTNTENSEGLSRLRVQIQWKSQDRRYGRLDVGQICTAPEETGVTVAQALTALAIVTAQITPRSALPSALPAIEQARHYILRARTAGGLIQAMSQSFGFSLPGARRTPRVDVENLSGWNLRE